MLIGNDRKGQQWQKEIKSMPKNKKGKKENLKCDT